MIERIYIDNFRCFTAFEVAPARINLLLGRNGSGKTSLFDVMHALASNVGSGHPISQLFPPEDLTRWDDRTQQRFELTVSLDDAHYRYQLVVEHDLERDRSSLVEETVTRNGATLFAYRDGQVHLHHDDGRHATSFPFRSARSFLPEVEARPENRHLMLLLGFLRSTRMLRLLPPTMESSSTEEKAELAIDGHDFPSWYRHLAQEHPSELHSLFDNLRAAIPGFRSLALVGAGRHGRNRDLVAKFDSPAGGEYAVDFDTLSDGQRALVVLYTLLVDIAKGSRVLLLDEPENFVGLPEIQPWLQSLDDVIGSTGQLMMISHHPEVIDFLSAEHPLHLHRDGGLPSVVDGRAELARLDPA